MPDLVHAWAAVAPDGLVDIDSVKATPVGVQDFIDWMVVQSNRPGWRVVPVKIEVMERTDV